MKAGFTKRLFAFALDDFAAEILPLAHQVALFGSHAHPDFGVTAEILPRSRRHREPPLAQALARTRRAGAVRARRANRRRPAAGAMLMRLPLCSRPEESEDRQDDERLT